MKTIALYFALFFASNAADSTVVCCTTNTIVIAKENKAQIEFYENVKLTFDEYITGDILIEIYTVQGRLATSTRMNLNNTKEITLGNRFFGDASEYTIFIIGDSINMEIKTKRDSIHQFIPDYVYHIE